MNWKTLATGWFFAITLLAIVSLMSNAQQATIESKSEKPLEPTKTEMTEAQVFFNRSPSLLFTSNEAI